MRLLASLFGLGLLATVSLAQEGKKESNVPVPPTDAERLRGTWIIESVRVNGRDEIAENHNWVDLSFTFEDNNFRFQLFPGRGGTFQLKADTTPKQIDFQLPKIKSEDGKSPGFVRAIYKFDGDRLRMTLGVTNEEDRPATFEPTDTGPPFIFVKLRRPDLADTDGVIGEEYRRLEGNWVLVATETNGQRTTVTEEVRLKVQRNHLTLTNGDKPVWKADMKLNITTSPRHADLTITESAGDHRVNDTLHGLYSIERGLWRICLPNRADDPRPANYETDKPGESGLVMFFNLEGQDVDIPPGTRHAIGKSVGLPGPASKLRGLRLERVKALRAAADLAMNRYESGQLRLTEMIALEESVYLAERELKTAAEDRIELLDARIRRLKMHEKHLEALVEAGKAPTQDHALIKATRLAAQIEREQLSDAK